MLKGGWWVHNDIGHARKGRDSQDDGGDEVFLLGMTVREAGYLRV